MTQTCENQRQAAAAMPSSSLDNLISATGAVVFHSPVTDLDGLPDEIEDHGYACHLLELGMGSAENRALFEDLRERTGQRTLPQVFIHGSFVGGIGATRHWLHTRERPGPTGALSLGYGGLLPFLLGVVLIALGYRAVGADVLAAYGAVILSFVGAVHWGLALGHDEQRWRHYASSVVPALVAWLALLLPPVPSLGVLAAGLAGWRFWECLADPPAFPAWFARLRDHLTLGASVALLLGMFVLAIPVAPT